MIAYLLFVLLNGTLAYSYRRCKLMQDGKAAPPYFQYLLFGEARPRLNAPGSGADHIIASLIAAAVGAFFVFCGFALWANADWSRLEHPAAAVALCSIPTGIGAAMLYAAWRFLADRKKSTIMSPNNSLDGTRGGS